MGDRSNICLQYEGGDRIFIYGHWMGVEMADALKEALEAAPDRWDDPSYLSRVIFCRVLKRTRRNPADALDDTTGAGISPYLTDNEYPIIVVDFPSQTIFLHDGQGVRKTRRGKPIKAMYGVEQWTFQAFDPAECKAGMEG